MLDENEFSVVQEAFRAAFSHAEGVGGGERNAVSVGIDDQFAPVLAAYCRLTGFAETSANAVMHHRLSLYGEACAVCSKPLRSPAAKVCVACGAPVKTNAPAL